MMTAQISDTVLYQNNEYSLIGRDGGDLVTPEYFGMEAEMISTACYRGFYATYALIDTGIVIRDFTLRAVANNYLPIQGIEPIVEDGKGTYHLLDAPISYTGRIRIARELHDDCYVHMGYQKATAFKTVLDVTLNNAECPTINDRSAEMQAKRGAFKRRFESGSITLTTLEAFDLSMDID